MPKSGMPSRPESARADAIARFHEAKQAKAAAWDERAKRHEADMKKMARLRDLRLEKEAADKVAAVEAKSAPRGKRPRITAPKPEDEN